jgi:hypothetical protein
MDQFPTVDSTLDDWRLGQVVVGYKSMPNCAKRAGLTAEQGWWERDTGLAREDMIVRAVPCQ